MNTVIKYNAIHLYVKLSCCIVETLTLMAGWRNWGSIRWKPLIISWFVVVMVQSNERTTAPISLLVPSTPGGRDGGGQMTSHMEEPRRIAAHVGKILISASDYPCMEVRIINNSGGFCIISHCTKEEGSCGVDTCSLMSVTSEMF